MTLAIDIKNLTKTYGKSFQALKGIDLEVKQGDFFALLGPNGAGKSTTIGILCSLVNKTSGSVKIFDVDIDKNFAKAKTFVGVVPQEFNFNQFEKVMDVVVTQGGYYGIPRDQAIQRAEKYLKQLGLWDKREEVSRNLSGGMKRRLMIARALVHEPKLLILDEPTAGVDIELRRSMWEFMKGINEQGTTIILTTHYLEEAESLCRNIAIIDKGEIIENSTMSDLLMKLDSQSFIMDLDGDYESFPEIAGFPMKKLDNHTVEVEIHKEQVLNTLFKSLEVHGIKVKGMRNKANRLEELFVKLVEPNLI